jgi:hypothetical protein
MRPTGLRRVNREGLRRKIMDIQVTLRGDAADAVLVEALRDSMERARKLPDDADAATYVKACEIVIDWWVPPGQTES